MISVTTFIFFLISFAQATSLHDFCGFYTKSCMVLVKMNYDDAFWT